MIDYNDEIVSIEYVGTDKCIDIEVSGDHLFYANGILTKNSLGVAATADAALIFGSDDDRAVYENEIQYKIVKNRLGGRVGEVSKLYYDKRTLKMYDSLELDIWKDDANITGDERNIVSIADPVRQSRGQRSRRD